MLNKFILNFMCITLLLSFAVLTAQDSKPDINPKISHLKDNEWVKLETSKLHPITRTSSPYMMYSALTKMGYLWGASHGAHHNGVWAFNMSTGGWKCMIPTESNAKINPSIIKLKDNIIMTANERPLAAHQWGQMDLDTKQNRIYYFSYNGGNQGVLYNYLGARIKDGFFPNFSKSDYEKANNAKEAQPLWYYDIEKNKWFYEKTTGFNKYVYSLSNKGTFRYFPGNNKFYMTPAQGQLKEQFRIYDPNLKIWEKTEVKLELSEKHAKEKLFVHSPWLYLEHEEKFVIVDYYMGTFLFDPNNNKLTQIISVNETPYGNLDGPVGAFMYDSKNKKVLCIYINYEKYKGGEILEKRGFDTSRVNVLALDIQNKRWDQLPSNESYPSLPIKGGGNVHHYYDPNHNAILIFKGSYNAPNGETWIYRFKR